jgi:hypothetical protein
MAEYNISQHHYQPPVFTALFVTPFPRTFEIRTKASEGKLLCLKQIYPEFTSDYSYYRKSGTETITIRNEL